MPDQDHGAGHSPHSSPDLVSSARPAIRLVDIAILAAAHIGLVYLLGAAGGFGLGTGYDVIGGLTLQAIAQVGILWLVLFVWRGLTWADIGLTPLPAGWIVWAVLLGIAMIIVVGPINLIVQSLLGGPRENPQIGMIEPTGATMWMMVATLGLTAVVVPVIEEILFRGVLYRWLRGFVTVGLAVFISSVLFAMAHGIPHLIPALAVLGAFLAWSFERTGSLWVPIIIHGVFNGIMMIMVYALLSATP
jgi:uncharacterized protein